MDNFELTDDRSLREAIDACRPGTPDVDGSHLASLAAAIRRDGSLQARYELVQSLDAKIGKSLRRVSVPPGLADRLMKQLEAADAIAAAGTSEPAHAIEAAGHQPAADAPAIVTAGADVASTVTQAGKPLCGRRFSDRFAGSHHFAGRRMAAAIAASLLLAAGLAFYLHSPQVNTDDVLALAGAQSSALAQTWNRMSRQPERSPLPRSVIALARGWQRVSDFLGRPAVAYQLVDGTGNRATLFEVDLDLPELQTTPPAQPQLTTGGRSVAAWKWRDRVYVLVITGPDAERRYRNFVDPSQTFALRSKRHEAPLVRAAA